MICIPVASAWPELVPTDATRRACWTRPETSRSIFPPYSHVGDFSLFPLRQPLPSPRQNRINSPLNITSARLFLSPRLCLIPLFLLFSPLLPPVSFHICITRSIPIKRFKPDTDQAAASIVHSLHKLCIIKTSQRIPLAPLQWWQRLWLFEFQTGWHPLVSKWVKVKVWESQRTSIFLSNAWWF